MNDRQKDYEIEQLKRTCEILAHERDNACLRYDRVMQILMRVHNLTVGPDVVLPDGRRMRFNDPNANETLHALSAAIRSIPSQIDAEKNSNTNNFQQYSLPSGIVSG